MQLFIFTDGGSRGNPGPSASGGVVYSESRSGELVHSFSEFLGTGTNNEAEYSALLLSIKWLSTYPKLEEVTSCTWHLDSKLVVEQISKNWKIKEPRMQSFARQCWELLATIPASKKFVYVPRSENAAADALVNSALDANRG